MCVRTVRRARRRLPPMDPITVPCADHDCASLRPCSADDRVCESRELSAYLLDRAGLTPDPVCRYRAARSRGRWTELRIIPPRAPSREAFVVGFHLHRRNVLRIKVPLTGRPGGFAHRYLDVVPGVSHVAAMIGDGVSAWTATADTPGDRHRRLGQAFATERTTRGTYAQMLYATADGTYIPARDDGRHEAAGVVETYPGQWPSTVVKEAADGDYSNLWLYMG